jgi:predicted transcriptional regulator of viral defense system
MALRLANCCLDNIIGNDVYYPSILSIEFMPKPARNLAKTRSLFKGHGGMLRTSEAVRLRVHPRTLYALRDSGELLSIGRGLYRLAKAPPLTHPDWVTVASRIPRAAICLISALAHHGLTTQVPHSVEIALPSHAQVPRIQGISVRVFWFPNRAFNEGVDVITVDRVPVRIYSPEKTIADCFKYRHKIGIDVAVEALRTYREKVRRLPVNKLLEYARICRVEKVMRPYLEAVL